MTLVCLTGTGLGSSLTAGVEAGAGAGVADDLGPSYVVDALVSRSMTFGAEVLPESHSSAVRAASRDGAGGKMLAGSMSLRIENYATRELTLPGILPTIDIRHQRRVSRGADRPTFRGTTNAKGSTAPVVSL